MKKSIIFILLIIAVIGITLLNFLTVGESTKAYTERIEKDRKNQNRLMRSNSSPLKLGDKRTFKGLNYYPVNRDYQVTAKLTPTKNKQPVFIPTTTGEQKRYIPYAYATFELDGQSQKLLLFKDWEEKEANQLSLMFADATSGDQTYGGGRYVELKKTSEKSIIIDFNTAYNPYCHFNDEYSCPIPPKENLMSVAIEAGEKVYKVE